MNSEDTEQYVCQVCGATKDRFLPAEENSARRHVEGTRINESVTRFNSVPKLGYEHAAYRVIAEGAVFFY